MYVSRAQIYNMLGQYGKAVEDCSKALSLTQKDSSAYLVRGQAYQSKRRIQEAIADLTHAINLKPAKEPYMAYSARAYAYKSLGQFQHALDDFTKAIAVYQTNPPSKSDELTYLNGLLMVAGAFNARAQVYDELKQVQKAIDDYTKCIAYCEIINSPSTFKKVSVKNFTFSPSPYSGRAADYEKLGKYDLAKADKKKGQETAPKSK